MPFHRKENSRLPILVSSNQCDGNSHARAFAIIPNAEPDLLVEIFGDPTVTFQGMRTIKAIELLQSSADPSTHAGRIEVVTSGLHWRFAFFSGSFECCATHEHSIHDTGLTLAIDFALYKKGFLREFHGSMRVSALQAVEGGAGLTEEELRAKLHQLNGSCGDGRGKDAVPVEDVLALYAQALTDLQLRIGADSDSSASPPALSLLSYEQFMRPQLGLPGPLKGRLDALAESNVLKLFGSIAVHAADPSYVRPSMRTALEALRDRFGVRGPRAASIRSFPLNDLEEWTATIMVGSMEDEDAGAAVCGVAPNGHKTSESESTEESKAELERVSPPLFCPLGLPSS